MTIKAQTTQKEYKLVPAGTHMARLYSIIHLGHVPNTYPGAENPIINKVRLTWELPEELAVFKDGEEPRPYSISQEYTLSMNEKANLRKMVQSWLGKQLTEAEAVNFDIEELIGLPCLLTVVHVKKTDRAYANVENITKPPAKMVTPEAVNPQKIINWDNLSEETFNRLPAFIQEKMKSSVEYKRWKPNGIYPDDKINADEIPF